jgi:hypothetical protein
MMNQSEQIQFIQNQMESIKRKIVDKIRDEQIPNEWNGFELRQYIADKCIEATANMGLSRKRKYNNEVLIRNL